MTHKLRIFLLAFSILALLGGLSGCGERAEQPVAQEAPAQPVQEPVTEAAPVVTENPFFEDWDTPYGIPPFDRIRNEHFRPAFDRGIEELRAEIAEIRDNPEPPTFENTVEALELAGPRTARR